ncbi:hypothetical protein [Ekhidna sp.]|uniref:hypothetical protein n=1 Tax=Ekhidna sp. TaxID=2608089 RepID=UPI003298A1FE
MKFITFTAICCFVSLSSISIQAQAPTFNPFFFGNKPEESKVFTVSLTSIGRYHFDEKWNAGNIYLNNGDSLVAYYMRYDLIRNQLEVIFDNDIKAINGSFIKRFEWFSVERLRPEKFVLRNDFKFDPGKEVTGFLQLLEDGNTKLLKCKRMYAPREATSPTLVNDTDTDIQSIEEYYLVRGGNAVELSGGKRKSLKIFDSKELTRYINDSNLKFNNESDLKEIVKYYNEKIN